MFFLLEFEVLGRRYRWSTEEVQVDADHVYEAGLDDLDLPDDALGVAVRITDSRVNWPELAPDLQGQRVTLRRWLEGDSFESSVVVLDGVIAEVVWSTRDEPVDLRLQVESSALLGYPVPDYMARVSGLTWPTGGGTLGDDGRTYPVILGYPGWEGAGSAYPIVPVPLAQWTALPVTTYVVVAEDLDAPITQVVLLNEQAGTVGVDETVVVVTDLLQRNVRAAQFALTGTYYPATATTARRFFAGYSPAGGGGVARDAYSVLEYMLKRWAPDTVDWSRLPEIRATIEPYQVDTWIDDATANPWNWLTGALLRDLPVEVRIGAGGRFLVPTLPRLDARQVVHELVVDNGSVNPIGTLRLSQPGPTNEFAIDYREDRRGSHRARVVATGLPAPYQQFDAGGVVIREVWPNLGVTPLGRGTGGLGLGQATDTQAITVLHSGRLADSVARYGLRRSQPRTLDWTWDEGTVLRVLEDRIEVEAIPAILAGYTLTNRERWSVYEGDVVRLTDTDRGLVDVLAVVVDPPVHSAETTAITLRIPR